MRFEGTDSYVATEDLTVAVNAAITLERPLLVKVSPARARPYSPTKSPQCWGCHCSPGTSNPPPKPSMACMNMMPLRACAMA